MTFHPPAFAGATPLGPMISATQPANLRSTCARHFGPPVAPATLHPNRGARMEVTVVVGDGEPIESALRRFKKEVMKSGHLFELKRRRYFETNTEKRLRKSAASKRKARIQRQMNEKGRIQRQQQRLSRTSALNRETPSETATTPDNIARPMARPTSGM